MTNIDFLQEEYSTQRGDNISKARLKGQGRVEVYNKIRKLAQQGLFASQIGEKLSVTDVTVYNTVKRFGNANLLTLLKENGYKSRRKISDELLEKAWELSKKGFGIDTICKMLNIRTVRDRLIRKYGKEQYSLYHPSSRFNTGFNQHFYYTAAGKEYQSLGELLIGTLLEYNNIEFVQRKCLLLGNKFYVDFFLPKYNKYIEYTGMDSASFYREKLKTKQQAYRRANLDCLYLNWKVSDKEELLVQKLSEFLNQKIRYCPLPTNFELVDRERRIKNISTASIKNLIEKGYSYKQITETLNINRNLLERVIRLSGLRDTCMDQIKRNAKAAASEKKSVKFYITEIFDSVQFENNVVSFCKPTIFVRFSGCNLRCFVCDSTYALSVLENKVYHRKEVFDKIVKLRKNCYTDLITVTGGEPLLYQKQIELLIRKFKHCKFDVETNGTIIPNNFLLRSVHFWNISPKLSSMANKAIRPSVVSFFNKLPNCIYKFVIGSERDLQELENVISKCKIPRNKVILMPEGVKGEILREKSIWVVEYCKNKGYRYSPRLHIMLYGNRRAV